MQVEPLPLAGAVVFRPQSHHDSRGFFARTFDADVARAAGIDPAGFVQDSQSRSWGGVVRGMHGRSGAGEAKLVRCARGAVWDVVVDVRPGSPTFGEQHGVLLDDVEMVHLYVPPGFLHGYQVLSDAADVCYRIDRQHDPREDVAVHHADPDLAIAWPAPIGVVSDRDLAAPGWRRLVSDLGM